MFEFEECKYSAESCHFKLWAPEAESVVVRIYKNGQVSRHPSISKAKMKRMDNGWWEVEIKGNLINLFYTFSTSYNRKWLKEFPGINARAVGLNGKRGAIIDIRATDPEGWDEDTSPALGSFDEIILYEVHHRDFSISGDSGMSNKGKYLAWTEKAGIRHLKELGITHVHLMPSFDFDMNETGNRYNWGYDPLNYNVPEGCYSSNPADPYSRIKEFKEMILNLHRNGFRVVMDVVFNHTSSKSPSNFDLCYPRYFYRMNPDGSYSNGSGCGNETASEKEMVRKYFIDSILWWIKEYHIDGFRFDLMGLLDIETINAIRNAVDEVNPTVFLYGEGWTAGACALETEHQALKYAIRRMPRISAFGDEMRDAVRGPFYDDNIGAFLCGIPGHEYNIRLGITGAIDAWTQEPTQMISYVSCHDDLCLGDRVRKNMQGNDALCRRAVKLAETIVLCSQGVPFIHAGDEFMRSKQMVHNSYNSPDRVNAIRWKYKKIYNDVFEYVCGMIAIRKAHKAFHLGSEQAVRNAVHFFAEDRQCLVAFRINGDAVGDSWKNIYVIFNGSDRLQTVELPQNGYIAVAYDASICEMHIECNGTISVPYLSAMILHD